MTLAEKALQIATGELGKEEKPRGSNWGLDVKKYLHSVGIDFPASWCMAFVYWCYNEAANAMGLSNPLLKTGGVLKQYNSRSKMVVKVPYPGDIFIMDYGKGLGHTGIVTAVHDDTVETIEGNTTNDTGSREGYEVCRRTRKRSSIKAYLRVP